MHGRETVPSTHFSRQSCSDPEVTVFQISGPLGPRARPYLERLTKDCLRRDLPRVVLGLDVRALVHRLVASRRVSRQTVAGPQRRRGQYESEREVGLTVRQVHGPGQ